MLHPRVPWKSSTGCQKGCRNTKLEPKVVAGEYGVCSWQEMPSRTVLLFWMMAFFASCSDHVCRMRAQNMTKPAKKAWCWWEKSCSKWYSNYFITVILKRFNHLNRLAKWFVQTWHPKKVPRSSMLKFDSSTLLGEKSTVPSVQRNIEKSHLLNLWRKKLGEFWLFTKDSGHKLGISLNYLLMKDSSWPHP